MMTTPFPNSEPSLEMGASGSASISDLSGDQQLKIYRQLINEEAYLRSTGADQASKFARLEQRHNELTDLYRTKSFACPKVRFGRTELQMPVITCGGMRMQETW